MSEVPSDKARSEWVARAIDRYQTHLIHYATQLAGDIEEAHADMGVRKIVKSADMLIEV